MQYYANIYAIIWPDMCGKDAAAAEAYGVQDPAVARCPAVNSEMVLLNFIAATHCFRMSIDSAIEC